MTNEIVSRSRIARQQSGLSQHQLAEAVGVSRQTIHNLETGRAVPSVALALRLSGRLGTSVEALFALGDDRIEAEWVDLGGEAARGPQRVAVGEVEGRRVAHVLRSGEPGAWVTGADAVATKPKGARVRLQVSAERRGTAFVAGCDPALGLLAGQLGLSGERVVWIPANSSCSLTAFARGQVHVGGIHLLDAASGTYNVPFVRATRRSATVVRLASWSLGLVVRRGNPLRLRAPKDLVRARARVALRERGSGAHGLLERMLAARELAALHVLEEPASSHHDVARLVAAGAADVGVSVASAASAHGLDFVPLAEESFDLAFNSADLEPGRSGARLVDVLTSAAFRRQVSTLGGYELSQSGKVVARCD